MEGSLKILILAYLIFTVLLLSSALGNFSCRLQPHRLETLNITVYPQWLKLKQTQVNITGFTFTFESTALRPMSLQNITVLLFSPDSELEEVSLAVEIDGSRIDVPLNLQVIGPTLTITTKRFSVTILEKQQVKVAVRFIPIIGESLLQKQRTNITCMLILDSYRITSHASLYTKTNLTTRARGRGTLVDIDAKITIDGNSSLKLRFTRDKPLTLCTRGVEILNATISSGGNYSVEPIGNCLSITGQGRLPVTLKINMKVRVERQDLAIATIRTQLKAGNTTIVGGEASVETGKVVTMQRPYLVPYIYTFTTLEPVNATLTLKIGGDLSRVKLVNGKATIFLKEAFWPILTPLSIEAKEIFIDNEQTTYYAIQDQPETVISGLATLTILVAAAVVASAAVLRRRKRKGSPPVEEFIEEVIIE
ncbi:MAG: hypothetical protein LM573_00535 [Thermofilum sp.]|nr:hypothetical protein [Thermofilum sp.]